MKNQNYEVQVLINNKPTKQYYSNNQWWVEAKKGAEFTVKIKNNTTGRVMAVVSVDSIDVLSGKLADDSSSGYIIPAFAANEIKGFRVSDLEVNKFEFADIKDSYAELSPEKEVSAKSCGVIGVRIYKEKRATPDWAKLTKNFQPFEPEPHFPYRRPYRPFDFHDYPPSRPYAHPRRAPWLGDDIVCSSKGGSDNAAAGVSATNLNNISASRALNAEASVKAPNFDVGTKFGNSAQDKVTYVSFERGELVDEYLIYYATRESLVASGVITEAKTLLPQAFREKSYCRPPKSR